MTANAIPNPDLNIYEEKTEQRLSEGCARVTLKQWFGSLLAQSVSRTRRISRGDAGLGRPSAGLR